MEFVFNMTLSEGIIQRRTSLNADWTNFIVVTILDVDHILVDEFPSTQGIEIKTLL